MPSKRKKPSKQQTDDFIDPASAIRQSRRRAKRLVAAFKLAYEDYQPQQRRYEAQDPKDKEDPKGDHPIESPPEKPEEKASLVKIDEYMNQHYPIESPPDSPQAKASFIENKAHLDDLLEIKRESDHPPDEFTNPYADSIPIMSILTIYPDQASWERDIQAALQASTVHRKALVAQTMFLNALRNTRAAEVNYREASLLNQSCEGALADNHEQWVQFTHNLPSITNQALKRATWCELLENEYEKMAEEWGFFWTWKDRCEQAGVEYREAELRFCTLLKNHCKKKDFLQAKIAESNDDLLPALFAPELTWLEIDLRVMRIRGEDGMETLRPIFFTKGNDKFARHCEAVQELDWEDEEAGSEDGSESGSDGGSEDKTE